MMWHSTPGESMEKGLYCRGTRHHDATAGRGPIIKPSVPRRDFSTRQGKSRTKQETHCPAIVEAMWLGVHILGVWKIPQEALGRCLPTTPLPHREPLSAMSWGLEILLDSYALPAVGRPTWSPRGRLAVAMLDRPQDSDCVRVLEPVPLAAMSSSGIELPTHGGFVSTHELRVLSQSAPSYPLSHTCSPEAIGPNMSDVLRWARTWRTMVGMARLEGTCHILLLCLARQ